MIIDKKNRKPWNVMVLTALSTSLVFGGIGYSPLSVSAETKTGSLNVSEDIKLDSTEIVSVIVELEEAPEHLAIAEALEKGENLSESQAKAKVETSQDSFEEDLSTTHSSYTITHTYQSVFNGFTIELPANQLETLTEIEGVKTVWENEEVQLIDPVLEESVLEEAIEPYMADSVPYLGVDRLHIDGITGDGVKVGVLDTGIDYTHPDLAAAYKGGYDFVDGDDDAQETTYDDWLASGEPEFNVNGNSYYTSHGTHVAGTIAGQGDNESDFATTGIAPDADLYSYRVLGPYGSGSTANVIGGIELSVEDGMDIINLSLGSANNDALSATSVAVNNAVLAGVTAVVSAGNNGRDGMYTLGSPGASPLAITVGANDVPLVFTDFTGYLDESFSAGLVNISSGFDTDFDELEAGEYGIVYAGLGSVSEFDQVDAEGKVALVARGELAFVDKIANAKAAGAEAIIIYNNIAGAGHIPNYFGEGVNFVAGFSLTFEDGTALRDAINEDSTFSFGDRSESQTPGGVLADFSSRGPVNESFAIKPEVSAPGVNTLSPVPSYMNGPEYIGDFEYAYGRKSGTSMSAPHVAGTAALLLEVKPELAPADVKTTLMNTANPMTLDYSVFEIGAGQIDPVAAIETDVLVQVKGESLTLDPLNRVTAIKDLTGALNYGTFAKNGKNVRDFQSVTFKNVSAESKTFTIEFDHHVGIQGSKDAVLNGVAFQAPQTVVVPAGETITQNIFFISPKTAEAGTYEGYINITNQADSNEQYRVPFAAGLTN
ncbi:S8 family serine peptidase [Alkalicoccobacillus murimartini]|uniref:Subtilisin family serine protease n=1 Tax=Alkalicoccobacillus murimartini TaxID=171685 RepID=A0ABT9YIS0_9BACI|nr:S8 family serine peptidase [Alkalicoccobacillus murimartini]MDQ0207754.1 subtilisin family serine protease [Alkalicoccobacillus murimartini]